MTSVRLGPSAEYLRLSTEDASGLPPQSLMAELRVEGLSATHTVANHYATGFADMARFFNDLASDWRG
jgi:hypothetical protein